MGCNKIQCGVTFAVGCVALTLPALARSQPLAAADGAPALQLRLETRIRYVNIDEGDKPQRVDVVTACVVAGADMAIRA